MSDSEEAYHPTDALEASLIDKVLRLFDEPPEELVDYVKNVLLSKEKPARECPGPVWVEVSRGETSDSSKKKSEECWAKIIRAWESIYDHRYSNPTLNPSPLGPDHEIFGLTGQARSRYKSQDPPFIVRRQRVRTRTVEIPSRNNQRARFPTKTQITAREWDDKNIFWTIDLRGKRYIVKSFAGQVRSLPGQPGGGSRYLSWYGSDFEKTAVAVSELLDHRSLEYSDIPDHLPLQRDTSEELSLYHADSREPSGPFSSAHQPNVKGVAGGRSRNTEAPESSNRSQHRSYRDDDDVLKSREKNVAVPQSISGVPVSGALKRGLKPTRHSELPRLVSSTGEAVHESGSSPHKRRKTEAPDREISHLYSASPPRSPIAPPTPTRRNNSGSAGQKARINGISDSDLPRHDDLPRSSPRQTPIPPVDDTVGGAASSGLSKEQEERTQFQIRMKGKAGWKPMSLQQSLGPSVSMFVENLLATWKMTADTVEGIGVIYGWLPESDWSRKTVMDAIDFPLMCETLLEEVQKAECWKGQEDDSCRIMLEILPKEKDPFL